MYLLTCVRHIGERAEVCAASQAAAVAFVRARAARVLLWIEYIRDNNNNTFHILYILSSP